MKPTPIFDDLECLSRFSGRNMLKAVPPDGSYPAGMKELAVEDYRASLDFLLAYSASPETFKAYRRELDRFLLWLWNIKSVGLKEITRHDVEAYLDFAKSPPLNWRSTEVRRRFLDQDGLRVPNPDWRPFVATVPKAARKNGMDVAPEDWQQSNGALKSMLRILSSYCQFLVDEDILPKNPVAQLKSRGRKAATEQGGHVVRRLTDTQVKALFAALGEQSRSLSAEQYERLLFIMSCMIGMYLRISEIASAGERQPKHGHFYRRNHESNGQKTTSWWFSVLGKGNKRREIPVSDEVLDALKRYRVRQGLPPLPSGFEPQPLFPKVIGKGGITSTRHVRMLIQGIFDQAHQMLVDQGQTDEALDLAACTVHWLRHTGISNDVMHRPLPHVRDSAGHSSLAVTGIYIDNDPLDAYISAKSTQLLPELADKTRSAS